MPRLAGPENRLAFLAVLILAAAYLPALAAPFVWDDLGWILFNRALEKPFPPSAYLSDAYFRLSGETSWRPLATATYNIVTLAAGKNPAAFRSLGLILHLLAGSLLFRLLLGSGLARPAALAAAGLFLVHPANVETLMCASFNEELLTGCAVPAMLLCHRAGRSAAAAGLLLAGLLSKETALVALPLVLLDDRCRLAQGRQALGGALPAPLAGGGLAPAWFRRNLPAYALYGATALAAGWFAVFGLSAPGFSARAEVPIFDRLGFVLESLWTFVRVQVLPVGLRIEYFALPSSPLKTAGLALFAAAFSAGAGMLLRRLWKDATTRPLSLFLAWPLLFWFVFSGAVPAGVLSTRLMAERWLYLPLMGSTALAGFALQRRPRTTAVVVALLGILMFGRVRDWTDERRLWGSLVRQYPWSAKAWEGLGDAHRRGQDRASALAAYEHALRLRGSGEDRILSYYVPISGGNLKWQSPSLRRSLGAGFLEAGDTARAAEHLAKAVELDPGDPYAYRLLSYMDARQGRFSEARSWAERGLSKVPEDDILLRLERASRQKRLDFRLKLD
ncbi:MAG: tetratricopeptide repeat protein [Elusimicrobia bacterium]|nr:tetratricopeptide repeat protein [Elusimicrobiota bacterium]